MRLLTAADAALMIPESATIAISGGSYRAVPETLIEALAARHARTGTPGGATIIAISMMERSRKGIGGEDTGLNRLARSGMVTRVISGSYARNPDGAINRFVQRADVAGYNVPMGTILQWLRATAAGRKGLLTPVGVGTFIDPRIEGGRINPAGAPALNRVVNVEGEELLFFPRLPIDVGLVKASSADEAGNLYFEREAYDHGAIDVAMAAHNSRGIVIAEVNRIVERGEINPRHGRIPGPLVDAVVVQPESWEDEHDPCLSGEARATLAMPVPGNSARDVIARGILRQIGPNSMVNLGAGLPMYDVPRAAQLLGRNDIYFTVEQGPMGGWPQVGGAAINPDIIMGQLEVFDFYEGGGPDCSVLAFGEIDRHGNVNVSRFADMMTGSGGFVNIGHGARRLIFCGTLTAGGLKESFTSDALQLLQEGRVRRFVDRVQQVTFNGTRAMQIGQRVSVVTERALFELTPDGFRLDAVMPGIDVRTNVLDLIPFPVKVSDSLARMTPW